ncbi:MAG: VCBS repeat-containing protein [Solirubrobacterales bacterium]|nr:VCBS repeat-containing protein [Solirubrobacterales bacterium]
MSARGLSSGFAAAVAACAAVAVLGAGSAQAGFVPALGSPFAFEPPAPALAVADADGNGTLDVVAGTPTLRHGAGSGFLGGPYPVGPAGGPAALALAASDLNLDGRTDYVALLPGDPDARLVRYLGLAGGGYVTEELVGADGGLGAAVDLAVAAIDEDGFPDVAVLGDTPGAGVTVVFGGDRETASFDSNVGAPTALAAADLDRDGRAELIAAGAGPAVRVLANAGEGVLEPGVAQPVGAAVGPLADIAAGDLDGDAVPDLVAADAGGAALGVLRGDGAGGLAPRGSHPSGFAGAATAVAIADVDGDGRADALAGGPGAVTLHLGDGVGGLGHDPSWTRATGGAPAVAVAAAAVADVNNDGQPDAVTANGEGTVSVLLNDHTGVMAPDPVAVDFGAVLPASGSRTAHVTLRSTRGVLRVTRVAKSGSPLFAVSDVDCIGRLLRRGQGCTVAVRFDAPRKAARHEALLSVDVNAPAIVVSLGATTRPPQILGMRLKRKRVRPGQRLALRYRLSEGALVRALAERALPGRRVAGECVEPRRGILRRKRCVRWEELRTVGARSPGGLAQVKIPTRAKPTGRRRGGRRLPGVAYPPGAYRLSLTAIDRFANRSEERRLRFRVLRPAKAKGKRGAGRRPVRR